jgi:phosphate acetyltransferase
MTHSFYLAPVGMGTGLTSACLGLVRALDRLGVRVAFLKPVAQSFGNDCVERSNQLINATIGLQPIAPLSLQYAKQLLAKGDTDRLLEEIVKIYQQSAETADVVVIEGLVPVNGENYIDKINQQIAQALNSDVVLVAAQNGKPLSDLNQQIEMTARLFGGLGTQTHPNRQLLGCILNKVGAPTKEEQQIPSSDDGQLEEFIAPDVASMRQHMQVFNNKGFQLLGTIRWNPELIAPRTLDVANHLQATIINEGAITQRRVKAISMCARTVAHMTHTLKAGTLLMVPGDRDDIMLAASLAAIRGVPLAGIILTGNMTPPDNVMQLCDSALQRGLPVLQSRHNTWDTAKLLNNMNIEVPEDDIDRMNLVMDSVAADIDAYTLSARARINQERRLSPPAFRHQLITKAGKAKKRVVLPEGEEPRTVEAAIQCHEKGIAKCVLLGSRDVIERIAEGIGLEIPDDMEILDPEVIRPNYIQPLVELRKHKGLTAPVAATQLEDTVVLATMMLALDEVDGLVSGAVHTTASTIRPALQFIKTKPDTNLVSSIFFMCLPDQVLVYGDCAVNPEPNAEELAEIAIQSGDSALAFGIEPRIAMISYSTGASGMGDDVEKVRQATKIVKEKRPDLIVDGPLQYDAASVASVAHSKAPGSPVAGKATVYIFPDLNTGNTTYKAVQRAANVVSIGPMLQGLAKPVNDLSRGALVDDIVYTIALTAIQADSL